MSTDPVEGKENRTTAGLQPFISLQHPLPDETLGSCVCALNRYAAASRSAVMMCACLGPEQCKQCVGIFYAHKKPVAVLRRDADDLISACEDDEKPLSPLRSLNQPVR